MKINDVIAEATNPSTGTPNPEPPKPAAGQTWTGQGPAPQWLGRKKGVGKINPARAKAQPKVIAKPNDPPAPANDPTPAPAAKAAPDPQTPPTGYTQSPGGILVPQTAAPKASTEPAPAQQALQPTAPAQQAKPAAQAQPAQQQPAQQQPAQQTQTGFDKFKGALSKGIQGAIQGYKQAGDVRRAKEAGGMNLNLELDSWKKFAAQTGAVNNMRDPKVFQTQLGKWLANRYPSATKISLSGATPNNVEDFITKAYSSAMANRATGAKAATPPSAQATPTTPQQKRQQRQQQILQKRAQGTNAPTPAEPETPTGTTPQASTAQQALAAGVTVKSQDPIIISTGKGKEYGLDDTGEWIHLASGKIPPESFRAFLNQQHDISLGIDKPQTPAQATPQAAAPAQQATAGVTPPQSNPQAGQIGQK